MAVWRASARGALARVPALGTDDRARAVVVGGLAVVIVAVTISLGVLLTPGTPIGYRGDPGSLSLSQVHAPSSADDDGGIPVGAGLVAGTENEGAVVVELLFDYRCPYGAVLDAANGRELLDLAEDGAITLVFRPLSLGDASRGSKQYSTRAATAAAIVADRAPESFVAFHEALFANRPQRGQGPSDRDLARVAREAGVPERVVRQLSETVEGSERTFARWVFAATERGIERLDGRSTPAVLVDGRPVPSEDLFEAGALRSAIEELVDR